MSFFGNLAESVLGAVGSGSSSFGLNVASGLLQNQMAQNNARYWARYNSPIEQMKRLKEAGLNPALVYGNGNVVNTADGNSSAPDIHGVSTNWIDPLTRENAKQDLRNKKAVEDKTDQETQLLREQTWSQNMENIKNSNADPVEMGKLMRQTTEEYLNNLSNDSMSKLSASQLSTAQSMLTYAKEEFQRIQNKYADTMAYTDLMTAEANRTLAWVNASYAPILKEIEVKLGKTQCEKLVSDIAVNASLKNMYEAQSSYLSELKELTKQNTDNAFYQKQLTIAEKNLTDLKAAMQEMENKLRGYNLVSEGLTNRFNMWIGTVNNAATTTSNVVRAGVNLYNPATSILNFNQSVPYGSSPLSTPSPRTPVGFRAY